MKYKIGVFGSAENNEDWVIQIAKTLGVELAKQKNILLITGASSGLPYEAAHKAYQTGKTEIWGFSPTTSIDQHKKIFPNLDQSIFSKLFFIPKEYEFANNEDVCKKYRNVSSTAHCEAGMIISGRWGTLNEFTNLYDMGKIIGVLTSTGGIADELKVLDKKITKKSKAKVFFNDSITLLIRVILEELGRTN